MHASGVEILGGTPARPGVQEEPVDSIAMGRWSRRLGANWRRSLYRFMTKRKHVTGVASQPAFGLLQLSCNRARGMW